MNAAILIHPVADADREKLRQRVADLWGAEIVVAHGIIYRPHTLPGFAATDDGNLIGLVTYTISSDQCEVVTLDSWRPKQGVGSALLNAVREASCTAACTRLWLITTNDNLGALRFYQKYGFRLRAVYPGAVNRARAIKPEIPLIGNEGIPLRDEIELDMELTRE